MSDDFENNGQFKALAAQITEDERLDLLSKVKKNTQAIQKDSKKSINKSDFKVELLFKLKKESIFTRIWLKIKSAFLNLAVEDVYNTSLVNKEFRKIEITHPGLIDYKKSLFLNLFYEKLIDLKKVQAYFTPYASAYEQHSAKFYILLSHFLMRDINEDILRFSDPYQIPFTKEPNKEVKASLVSKMDEIISSIPSDLKTQMYNCVRAAEWIKQFCRFNLNDILNKFTNSDYSGKDCIFSLVRSDYAQFAKIMAFDVQIPVQTIQAFVLLNAGGSLSNFDQIVQNNEFIHQVNALENESNNVSVFQKEVPVALIGKVVFENCTYAPPQLSGGEDWFLKFKNHWKAYFDHQWLLWNRDYKLDKLKLKLNLYYQLPGVPLFAKRPWEKFDVKEKFLYGWSLGFLSWYHNNEYTKYEQTIRTLMLEGDFSIKENSAEFTDSVKQLNQNSNDIDLLLNQLSAGGEYGTEFGKIDSESIKTKNVREKVAVMMKEINNSAEQIINNYLKTLESFRNLFKGILQEEKSPYYGPLNNFNKIQGMDNKLWKERLVYFKVSMERSAEVLEELIPLDLPLPEIEEN